MSEMSSCFWISLIQIYFFFIQGQFLQQLKHLPSQQITQPRQLNRLNFEKSVYSFSLYLNSFWDRSSSKAIDVKLPMKSMKPKMVPTSPPTQEKNWSSLLKEREQTVWRLDFMRLKLAYLGSVTWQGTVWNSSGTVTPLLTLFSVKGRRLQSVYMVQSSTNPMPQAPKFLVKLTKFLASMQQLRQSALPGLIIGLMQKKLAMKGPQFTIIESIIAQAMHGLLGLRVVLHWLMLISMNFMSLEMNLPYSQYEKLRGGHSHFLAGISSKLSRSYALIPKCYLLQGTSAISWQSMLVPPTPL